MSDYGIKKGFYKIENDYNHYLINSGIIVEVTKSNKKSILAKVYNYYNNKFSNIDYDVPLNGFTKKRIEIKDDKCLISVSKDREKVSLIKKNYIGESLFHYELDLKKRKINKLKSKLDWWNEGEKKQWIINKLMLNEMGLIEDFYEYDCFLEAFIEGNKEEPFIKNCIECYEDIKKNYWYNLSNKRAVNNNK